MKVCGVLLAFAMTAPWAIGAPWHGSRDVRRQSGINRTNSRRTDRDFTHDHQYLHVIAPLKTNETNLPSWPLRTLPVEGPPPEKRYGRPHMNVTASRPGMSLHDTGSHHLLRPAQEDGTISPRELISPPMNSTRKAAETDGESESESESDADADGSHKAADRTFRFRPRKMGN